MGRVVTDKWTEPTGKKIYKPTEKEEPEVAYDFQKAKFAHWMFARQIEDKLGPEGGTTSEIYYEVGGPLGLTSSQTIELTRAAKKEGYLV